jgi:serine/threonine-protein kinase
MAELRPGQIFAGHRIERVAGRGGMGVVYAATDMRLKRLVALKVIAPALAAEPNFQQRFERECELAASIDHPGVIAVYSAGEVEGSAYVTMRYIEGTDLAEMIRSRGRLPAPLVAEIAAQVGEALEAAHAGGLVHRDVKPANVLVREERGRTQAFLTDFGLTRQLTSDTRLTSTGAVIGTVDYMAPEQLADAPLDSRTDVYALGCVLYQALTGSVPFPTEAAPAKLYAHAHADRPSLLELVPDLPPALDRVIRKAMAKAPEDRFQSAADLGMAAAAAIEGSDDGPMTAAVGVGSGTVPELAPETAPAGGPPTAGAPEPAGGEAATTPVPPGTPPLPPARRQPPPARGPAPRRRRDLIAVALGVAVLLTAGAIAFVVFGGSDDEGSGGGATPAAVGGSAGGGSGGGGEPESGPSPEEVARIAADVPAGGAANVTAYDRGLIEQEGFERRATLVRARDPGLSEKDARVQALDELILNRWMRGEADARGIEISDEQVSAELSSPEFATEAERLRSVGYLEGGVALDAEARIAAEEIFGDGSQAVVALTGGYGPVNADELAELVARWRPDTACTVELAPLSPLCANGPEP